MEPLKRAITETLSALIERQTGVTPVLKPSKKAHLASNSFILRDADRAAETLKACASQCTLSGAPLLKHVRAENGWLLFWFDPAVLDAYAERLPVPDAPSDSYLARRLWMAARRDDAPVPDDPDVLQGFFAALFGLKDGVRMLLAAPRKKDGMERVALELRLTRLARILLYERRNNV